MTKAHVGRSLRQTIRGIPLALFLPLLIAGCGVNSNSTSPTVLITANPASINPGSSATLIVTAINATQVTVSGSDGSTYSMLASGGTQSVSPKATTTYYYCVIKWIPCLPILLVLTTAPR